MQLEPVSKALTLAGVDLVFTGFTIKGVVGFNLTTAYKGEQSLYAVEQQNFSFQIATSDVVLNNVAIDMLFTLVDGTRRYTMKVARPPIDDLTGWSELHTNLITIDTI